MRRRIIGLVAVLALVAAACGESTGADDTTAATTADTVLTAAPSGGGDAVNGQAVFTASCVACHGADGQGVEGLGKTFVGSEFINGLSDEDVVAFIKVGRPTDDPANTTGIAMLPKGGNPALTDDDLFDIVAWIRTLNP